MVQWGKIPFVRLVIPFILGIIIALFSEWIEITWIHTLVVVHLVIGLALKFLKFPFKWRLGTGVIVFNLILLLGYEWAFYHNELHSPHHFKEHIADKNTITGIVTEKIERPNTYRLTLSVQKIQTPFDTSYQSADGSLQVYLRKDSIHAPPQYGDLIVLQSAIKRIEPPLNPDAVDFQWYWHLQNIHYQCFIHFDDFKTLGYEYGKPLISFALNAQSYFLSIFKQHLQSEDEYAVASALIIGNKEAISEDIKNAYIETGAMHILAISGMHFILIFGRVEWFFNLYKSGNRHWRRFKALALIIIIILFALLTGLGASIVRAAIMSISGVLGRTWNREVSIFNSIAASAFILLLWNPLWLFDIGFQLSYAAVIGIALWGKGVQKWLLLENKILRAIWDNISIGLVAQLAVAPLSLFYFHQMPVYFWLSGLVAGWVSEIALGAGIALLILNKILILSFVLGEILFGSIWIMNHYILWIQALPYNMIEGFSLQKWEVLLLYLSLVGFYIAFKIRKMRLFYYPLSILLLFTISQAYTHREVTHTQQVIVYNIPKISLFEVILDRTCYTFSKKNSENFNDFNKIKFATYNHHNSLKINTLKQFNYNEYEKNGNFIYHNKVTILNDVKLILLDRLPKTQLSLPNCFVVIHGNPKFSIQELKQVLDFKQVIFDASNSFNRIKKWREECEALKLPYHDTTTKGAWIYNL